MREGWKTARLADVCTFKPPKKEARQRLNPEDAVSFVPMNNLGVRKKELELCEERLLEKVAGSYTYFAEGDVLLAKITPCFENGKLGIASGLTNGVGFGSSEFIVMRPGDELDAEYLFYLLSQDSVRDAGARVMSGAVGHKRVPKELVEGLQLTLPAVTEQKRIVAILDGAFAGIDAAIANTEKNLANARELFESYMNVVFGQRGDGWSHAKFSDAVSTVRPPRKVQRKEFLESGQFPIVSQEQGTINGRWSRQEDVIRVDKPVIIFGDHTRVFKYIDFDFVAGADGTKILKSAPFLHPKYLYYFAQSVPLEGLGYARHYRILKDTDVWYPEDVSDQEAISIRLDELVEDLNKLDAVYNRRLSALAELKQSLLQKAFSGELTADAVDAEDRVEAALA